MNFNMNLIEQDIAETQVLSALMDELIKESAICEYKYEDVGAVDSVPTFERAINFIKRIITRFIAWIKNGQIKRSLEVLEKMGKDKNFTDTFSNNPTLYTMCYPEKWLDDKLVPAIGDFVNSKLFKLISDGTIKLEHDRDAIELAKSRGEMIYCEKRFTKLNDELKSLKPVKIDDTEARSLVKVLRLASGNFYDALVRSYDAIKLVKKAELKEIDDVRSKQVNQQIVQALSLFGRNALSCMNFYQKIVKMLVKGCAIRAISITGQPKVFNDITLEQLKDICREVVSQSKPKSTFYFKTDKTGGGTLIRIFTIETDNNGDQTLLENKVRTKNLNQSVEKFIMDHSNGFTSIDL